MVMQEQKPVEEPPVAIPIKRSPEPSNKLSLVQRRAGTMYSRLDSPKRPLMFKYDSSKARPEKSDLNFGKTNLEDFEVDKILSPDGMPTFKYGNPTLSPKRSIVDFDAEKSKNTDSGRNYSPKELATFKSEDFRSRPGRYGKFGLEMISYKNHGVSKGFELNDDHEGKANDEEAKWYNR